MGVIFFKEKLDVCCSRVKNEEAGRDLTHKLKYIFFDMSSIRIFAETFSSSTKNLLGYKLEVLLRIALLKI